MRFIFLILIAIISCNLFSQKIELFGGANKNVFHDYNNDRHFSSTYNSDYGFSAGFGLDSIKIDWLTLRFTLEYDKYKGKLNATHVSLGGGNTTIANIDKSVISLGIFPINFLIFKRIDLNFGLLISRLITESNNGTITGWKIGSPDYNYILQDRYKRYSTLTYFGFQGRIAYDFKISQSIIISPQYIYYFGFSNEFVESPEDTKSMRHYFRLGIEKNFK